MVEQKAHRGRLWKMLGKDQLIQGVCENFSLARAKAKNFIKDAEKEKQEGIPGQSQRESSAKGYLEQVKRCTPRMMRFGYFALKDGEWEEYKETSRLK